MKDKSFKFDLRKDEKISGLYDWEALHHIYSVARSIYSGTDVGPLAMGTMLLLPCLEFSGLEPFDYIDKYASGVNLIRLGPYFIMTVLNDCGVVGHLLRERLNKITGPLQLIQIREIYARASEANLRIMNRPRFFTAALKNQNNLVIDSHSQKIELSAHRPEVLGMFMYQLIADFLPDESHPSFDESLRIQREALKEGRWTYLFDASGNFLTGEIRYASSQP